MSLSAITEYLPYTLGIGAILVVVFGYLMVKMGYNWQRLMDMWKPNKTRHIPTIMFCEDGSIRDRRLEIGRFVISDHDRKLSFYLVHKLELGIARSKRKILALSERSTWPIDFHNKIDDKDKDSYPASHDVFADKAEAVSSYAAGQVGGQSTATVLSLVMAFLALMFVIVGGITMLG